MIAYIHRHPPASHFTEVKGAAIHYLRWHQPNKATVLLVHGHAAHAHWWDAVAIHLRKDFDIIAVDLSGCGDSDHRVQYDYNLYTRELMTVCEDAEVSRPIIVGHSFGGTVARIACFSEPELASRLTIIDSPLRARRVRRDTSLTNQGANRLAKIHYFDTEHEAIKRFRLRPAQRIRQPELIQHIARHAITETDQGFRFKLDLTLLERLRPPDTTHAPAEMLRQLAIPIGLITGKESVFYQDTLETGQDNLLAARASFKPERWHWVDDAAHHVLLDQPRETARLIKVLSN